MPKRFPLRARRVECGSNAGRSRAYHEFNFDRKASNGGFPVPRHECGGRKRLIYWRPDGIKRRKSRCPRGPRVKGWRRLAGLVAALAGQRVTVDIHNDTDTPELVHWHGQMIPSDVDGASEEGTAFVPAHGMRRVAFVPKPSGFRFYHTHVPAGAT
jgi:hypothetical protein